MTMMDQQLQKCLRCTYDLNGHPHKGLCPECGKAYGDELILIGQASTVSTLIWMSTLRAAVMLLGIMLLYLSRFSGALFVLSLIPLFFGVRGLIKVWLIHKARVKWGGDLRWIVSEDGIRVRRGLITELNLLEWRYIRKIKKTRGLGFRAIRGLKVTRSFASIDIFRYKSQPIWLGKMTKEKIITIQEEVRSKRP